MSLEDQITDRKSLKTLTGKNPDWDELAKDCVCFANGQGGRLLIGIEDGQVLPPDGQRVDPELLDKLRKRIGELTVNVQALPSIVTAANGAQYIDLMIDRAQNVASTCDGRYFLRVANTCQPVLGEDNFRGYPGSKIGEISNRVGKEISRSLLKRTLADLVQQGVVLMEGRLNGARYRLLE